MVVGIPAPSNAATPPVPASHVFGWGRNAIGQLADGTRDDNRYTPVPAVGLPAGVRQVSNFIGRVQSQTPAAGTIAPLGSTVTIRVGVLPDHRCP
jgi:hypothetical protein